MVEDSDKMGQINDILKNNEGDMFDQMNHETIDPYSQPKNNSGQFNNMLAANHPPSNIFDDQFNSHGTPEGGGAKPSGKVVNAPDESMEALQQEEVQFRNDDPMGLEESPKKGKTKGKKGKKGKGKSKTGAPKPLALEGELNDTAGEEAFEAAPRDVSPTKKSGKKGKKKKDELDDAKAYLTDMKETGQNFQNRGESG